MAYQQTINIRDVEFCSRRISGQANEILRLPKRKKKNSVNLVCINGNKKSYKGEQEANSLVSRFFQF